MGVPSLEVLALMVAKKRAQELPFYEFLAPHIGDSVQVTLENLCKGKQHALVWIQEFWKIDPQIPADGVILAAVQYDNVEVLKHFLPFYGGSSHQLFSKALTRRSWNVLEQVLVPLRHADLSFSHCTMMASSPNHEWAWNLIEPYLDNLLTADYKRIFARACYAKNLRLTTATGTINPPAERVLIGVQCDFVEYVQQELADATFLYKTETTFLIRIGLHTVIDLLELINICYSREMYQVLQFPRLPPWRIPLQSPKLFMELVPKLAPEDFERVQFNESWPLQNALEASAVCKDGYKKIMHYLQANLFCPPNSLTAEGQAKVAEIVRTHMRMSDWCEKNTRKLFQSSNRNYNVFLLVAKPKYFTLQVLENFLEDSDTAPEVISYLIPHYPLVELYQLVQSAHSPNVKIIQKFLEEKERLPCAI